MSIRVVVGLPFDHLPNLLPDAESQAYYIPSFLDPKIYDLDSVLAGVHLQRFQIRIFGRWVDQPRTVSWMADPGVIYGYSGKQLLPQAWTPMIFEIRHHLNQITQRSFNGVLINYYADGNDSMGWHRDNEAELGIEPWIASFSFGETRDFLLRPYQTKKPRIVIPLENASLLLMKGKCQERWEHSLPKRAQKCARLNLTFREVKTNPGQSIEQF